MDDNKEKFKEYYLELENRSFISRGYTFIFRPVTIGGLDNEFIIRQNFQPFTDIYCNYRLHQNDGKIRIAILKIPLNLLITSSDKDDIFHRDTNYIEGQFYRQITTDLSQLTDRLNNNQIAIQIANK